MSFLNNQMQEGRRNGRPFLFLADYKIFYKGKTMLLTLESAEVKPIAQMVLSEPHADYG